jgi:serine/threonine protein kinase
LVDLSAGVTGLASGKGTAQRHTQQAEDVSRLRERLQASLGRTYAIERELGGGGMSRVFVADETSLGRKVVVKVLPPELAAGVNVDRFKREIQVAARLQHPHIVPVLSAGEFEGAAVLRLSAGPVRADRPPPSGHGILIVTGSIGASAGRNCGCPSA